jgi:hypothetical protein
MFGRACSAVASYMDHKETNISPAFMPLKEKSFSLSWCPVPVQVRTNAQTVGHIVKPPISRREPCWFCCPSRNLYIITCHHGKSTNTAGGGIAEIEETANTVTKINV